LGSYNTLKATIPYLKESKGSVLFVSATLHYRGTVLQAHVSAAKAAVDALSQAVAVEYGPFGVRSNVIAPGAIAGTEGAERLLPKGLSEKLMKPIPLGRMGTADEIADCTGILDWKPLLNVVFIFSDAARYITGTIFVVDGGQWHRFGLFRKH
jgi:2,4-dienoyl-CoA reductase [(3E)-enoyl-CoA-producing], peroxisomal